MKFLFSLDRCRHTRVSSVCRDTSCHPHWQASQSAGFVRGQTHRFQVWGARIVLPRWVRPLFSPEFNPLDAIDGVCYLLPTSRNKDHRRNLIHKIKEPYLNETQGIKMWLIKSYAVDYSDLEGEIPFVGLVDGDSESLSLFPSVCLCQEEKIETVD